MADNMEKDVKEVNEMSKEEKVLAWENWVRSQINAVLDVFLSPSKEAFINIEYKPLVIEVLESGPVLDDSKVTEARVKIDFVFEEPIDRNKSIE